VVFAHFKKTLFIYFGFMQRKNKKKTITKQKKREAFL